MYCVDRLELGRYYYVRSRYYLKVDSDGVIHVMYDGDSVHLNVVDYFDFKKRNRIYGGENYNLKPDENEIAAKNIENYNKNIEDLPLNAYLDFEVSKLKEVLKKLEDREDYEKCAKIRDIINFKEEEYGKD